MLAASVSHLFSLVYDYYSSDSSSYCCCCVDGVPMPISWCIAAHAQQQLLLYLGSSSKKRKKTGGWRECWSKEEEEEKRRRYKIFIKTHQAPGWSIIPGAACNSRLLLLLSPVPFAGKWERHKKPRSSPLRKRKGRRRRKSLWSIPSSKRAAAVQFFFLCDVWCVGRFLVFCRCCCWIRNSFLRHVQKEKIRPTRLSSMQRNILTSQVNSSRENITLNITQNV